MKKIIAIGIAVLVCLVLIPSVSATWCDNDYGKKAPILINNTGGSEQTYYQVMLNYSYDSDMNANFSDARVYNESDCSLVPLWNESAVASSYNKIWFNATNIPSSVWCNDTYYLYYDYSSASSASNGTNTFEFFDDFKPISSDVDISDATTLWGSLERAVYFSGTHSRTYVAYMEWSTDKIKITYYDHTTDKWAEPVEVASAASHTAHCAPSLSINSSGYIFVSYPTYGSHIYVKKSSNSENISAWGSAKTIESSGSLTAYAFTTVLSNDHIVMVYRKTATTWATSNSTDNGDTWSSPTTIISSGDSYRPYVYIYKGTSDRIHLGWSKGTGSDFRDIYYAYSDNEGNTWKNISGTTQSLPMSCGADVRTLEETGVFALDIMSDSSNTPVILFNEWVGHEPRIVKWSGSAWVKKNVSESTNNNKGSSLIVTNSNNYTVYWGKNVSGYDEMHEYTTSDGGNNWNENTITSDSSNQHVFPSVPLNFNSEVKLVWFYGSKEYDAAHVLYFYNANTTSFSAAQYLGEDYNLSDKWSVVSGSFSASNNYLESTSTPGLITVDTPSSVGIGREIRCKNVADTGGSGLILAYQDSSNFYHAREESAANELQIYKWVGASATKLDGQAYAFDDAAWYILKVRWISASEIQARVEDLDGNLLVSASETADLESWTSGKIGFRVWNDMKADDVFVRKYTTPEPTASLGTEESPSVTYTPPDPTNLQNTTGNFWANYTWSPDSGNVTNGYNVTWNSSWYNTSNTYMNKSVGASNWANITVWAWNSSGSGTMSAGNVSDQVQAAAADTTFTVSLPTGYTKPVFQPPNSTATNYPPNGQQSHRKQWTVTNINATALTNYPAYVNVTDEPEMQADWDDVVFTDSAGNLISYELENYTAGFADYWVNISSLPGSGTYTGWIYYGNDGASSQEDPEGVYDSHTKMVHHMQDLVDSTSNDNDATNHGATYTSSGQVDGAYDYNGSSDYWDCGNDMSLNITGPITIEAWVKPDAVSNNAIVGRWGTGSVDRSYILLIGTSKYQISLQNSTGGTTISSDTIATLTQTHVVGTFDGTNLNLYVNGLSDAIPVAYGGNTQSVTSDVLFGRLRIDDLVYMFNGTIDNAIISSTVRSADWINQSYELVVNQSSWVSWGGAEEGTPFFNVTNTGNVNLDVRMRLNATVNTITLKADTDNNPTGAKEINTTLATLYSGLGQGSSADIWLWSDFDHTPAQTANRTVYINVSES